ncbi:MAG TPA: FG-GAP-like repeat-containing protein [Terracidiphilus sp.]
MSYLRCALAAAVSTLFACAAMAQKTVTFNAKTVAGGNRPGNLYTTDFNKDGLPDILQDTAETPDGWSVILASGPGNFRSPVLGAERWGMDVTQLPLAIADFNGDGIPDVAVAIHGTYYVNVYLGKADGTLATVETQTDTYNPDIPYFADYSATSAADFNSDGKADLIAEHYASGGTPRALYVYTGNGDGRFGIVGALAFAEPSGTEVHNVVVGDFNGDGHADVAFVNTTLCASGSTVCSAVLHVLYGDGKLGFRDTTVYTAHGPFNISAGDLNSDGKTDLFGVDAAAGQLAVFYGGGTGTFSSYFSSVPPGTFGATSAGGSLSGFENYTQDTTNAPFSPQLAMADFNADWKMDLAGYEHNAGTGKDSLVFFLSTGSPGAFTTQIQPLPSHLYTTNPIVADFNHDGKPDVAVNQSDGGSSNMTVFINSTSGGIWSNCLYPPKGINVCSPNQTAVSPVAFSASAGSYGDVRKMELWIDGKKIEEQNYTWGTKAWFNSSASLANGTHAITFYSGDIDNALQKVNFSLNVGPPVCAAPSAPGIAVCTPTAGATVGRPIAVHASATVDGTFARMEIWVDGVKEYTQATTPYLDAAVPAPPGSHQMDIYAVNTLGASWHSVVNVTAH